MIILQALSAEGSRTSAQQRRPVESSALEMPLQSNCSKLLPMLKAENAFEITCYCDLTHFKGESFHFCNAAGCGSDQSRRQAVIQPQSVALKNAAKPVPRENSISI